MDQWETIRIRVVRDNEPIKVVARDLGISRNTVRKYIRSLDPPAKVKLRRACRLDAWRTAVSELLRSTPKITAKRIGTILRQRYNPELVISERSLREYVASLRRELVPKEAFVRAAYAPGFQAQFDFSPMRAVLAGEELEVQIFVMRLSYSGHFYARASHRQDRPALFCGLLRAVQFFDGIPHVAIFDNAKTAVKRILKGRDREENPAFLAFRGALALEVQYAAPRAGNQKGGVEGYVGYIEDNFFRPTPAFASLDDLNVSLERFCLDSLDRQHSDRRERVADRFERERTELRPLPERLPEPCVIVYARVNKFAEVNVETNRYSVPTRFVSYDALAKIFDDRVAISIEGVEVACHKRSVGKHREVIDPLHYVDLISHKHRAALHALAFADERLPRPLIILRDRLIERDGATATKTWMSILRLALECSLKALVGATEIALSRGTLDPSAIGLLLRQRGDLPTTPDPTLRRTTPGSQAQVVDLEAYRISGLAEKTS
jgi:transposase